MVLPPRFSIAFSSLGNLVSLITTLCPLATSFLIFSTPIRTQKSSMKCIRKRSVPTFCRISLGDRFQYWSIFSRSAVVPYSCSVVSPNSCLPIISFKGLAQDTSMKPYFSTRYLATLDLPDCFLPDKEMIIFAPHCLILLFPLVFPSPFRAGLQYSCPKQLLP